MNILENAYLTKSFLLWIFQRKNWKATQTAYWNVSENPYIKHYLSAIALNSVSKFKVRVLPSILEYIKRYDKMPTTLLFAFKKLIEFYKTDMTNDDADVVDFMKNHSTVEILANAELWGEDISFLAEEIEKC